MKTFNTFDEILHFAIASTQETANFFSGLSKQARNAKMKKVFEQYSRDEFTNMVRLSRVREIGPLGITSEQMNNLYVHDYEISLGNASELKYSEALVVAMRKARASLMLYMDIASKTPNNEIKSVFSRLANEEAKHKRGFEIEYNESLLLC